MLAFYCRSDSHTKRTKTKDDEGKAVSLAVLSACPARNELAAKYLEQNTRLGLCSALGEPEIPVDKARRNETSFGKWHRGHFSRRGRDNGRYCLNLLAVPQKTGLRTSPSFENDSVT